MTQILGEAAVSASRVYAWLIRKGADPLANRLTGLYFVHAPERGVRPEVAVVQAMVETGWGRFSGVVSVTAKNPCGLKVQAGGSNTDPAAHAVFPTWAVGVLAHLDHLALYAGAPSYPRLDTPDPRHVSSLRGTAKTVEALGGRWAPATSYGTRIATLLKEI